MNNKRLFELIDCFSFLIFFLIVFMKGGATGAGILAASMMLYFVIYIIFIGGVGNTMARMVVVRIRRGFKENAKKIFGYIMLYSFLIGTLFLVLFISVADNLSQVLFKDTTASAVVSFLGILMLIHVFSYNIKCYYMGCGGHILMVIADIVMDIILPVGAFFVIDFFIGFGEKVAALKNNDMMVGIYAAIGAVLVIGLAMLTRLLILLVGLRGVLRQDSYSFNEVRTKDGFRTFIRNFFPEYIKFLRNNLFPMLVVFANLLIFIRVGFTSGGMQSDIYPQTGFLMGCGLTFALFALRCYSGYSNLLYSKMRGAYKKEDKKTIVYRYTSYAKSTLIIAVPAFITLLVFSRPICEVFFDCHIEDMYRIAIMGSFVFLLLAIDGFFTAGLRASGYDLINLLGNVVGFAVSLIYILISGKSGVSCAGFMWAMLIYALVCMAVHGFYAYSYIGIKSYDLAAKFVRIIIAALAMFLLEFILVKLVAMNIVIILITVAISYLLYWVVFVVARGLNQKELGYMQGTFVFFPLRFLSGVFHIR